MIWRKLGRVYVAQGERGWQASHAYCPTPLSLGDGRLRVFCAFLDQQKIGRAGWVDVDEADPTRVIAVSTDPVLDVGEPGTFDDNGVTPLSVLRLADGRVRLYYAGWQLGVRVRYFLYAGLAESVDGGETFQRVKRTPVLERSDGELHMRTGVHVQQDEDGFRMWYLGGSDWVLNNAGVEQPRYSLRHVRSSDGVCWPSAGEICLEPQGEEIGFGRPYVLAGAEGFRMWFSVRERGQGYRLAYAESSDGVSWERRDDESGLALSAEGWDSQMIGLSAIHQSADETYLFYNGNNYGETGFGVAVAEGL